MSQEAEQGEMSKDERQHEEEEKRQRLEEEKRQEGRRKKPASRAALSRLTQLSRSSGATPSLSALPTSHPPLSTVVG
jgi:hypothetical protein